MLGLSVGLTLGLALRHLAPSELIHSLGGAGVLHRGRWRSEIPPHDQQEHYHRFGKWRNRVGWSVMKQATEVEIEGRAR